MHKIEHLFTCPNKCFSFQSPEIIFNPALFNIESELGGIHNIVHKACNACCVEDRGSLYNNIELIGGNTLFPYLPDRLKSMVAKLALPITKVRVCANPERKYLTWIGGSMIASLSSFQCIWIHKQEYEEYGPDILRRHKCVWAT